MATSIVHLGPELQIFRDKATKLKTDFDQLDAVDGIAHDDPDYNTVEKMIRNDYDDIHHKLPKIFQHKDPLTAQSFCCGLRDFLHDLKAHLCKLLELKLNEGDSTLHPVYDHLDHLHEVNISRMQSELNVAITNLGEESLKEHILARGEPSVPDLFNRYEETLYFHAVINHTEREAKQVFTKYKVLVP